MINTHGANMAIHSKHEFDLLRVPSRQRVGLYRATANDLEEAASLAANEIPGDLAALDVVRNAISHNSNNVLLFKNGEKIVGLWSMLMLNPRGVEALLLSEFKATNPPCAYLSTATEPPAAIYAWAVVAPGLASEGIRHVAQFLRQPLYAVSNLFSRPNTDVGVKLNLSLGFRPIGESHPGFYRYVRLANRSVLTEKQAA